LKTSEDKVGCQGFIVFGDNKNYSSGDTHRRKYIQDIGYI